MGMAVRPPVCHHAFRLTHQVGVVNYPAEVEYPATKEVDGHTVQEDLLEIQEEHHTLEGQAAPEAPADHSVPVVPEAPVDPADLSEWAA
jgi:hypothetical protein